MSKLDIIALFAALIGAAMYFGANGVGALIGINKKDVDAVSKKVKKYGFFAMWMFGIAAVPGPIWKPMMSSVFGFGIAAVIYYSKKMSEAIKEGRKEVAKAKGDKEAIKNGQSGFTLLEVIIMIAILAIIVLLALDAFYH